MSTRLLATVEIFLAKFITLERCFSKTLYLLSRKVLKISRFSRRTGLRAFQGDHCRSSTSLPATIRLTVVADRGKESTKKCNYERPPRKCADVRKRASQPTSQPGALIFSPVFSQTVSPATRPRPISPPNLCIISATLSPSCIHLFD